MKSDIKKIMIIGSGPIVIGQAAEFDYAGTQACLALKEEGYETVLVNSNPATIMTDTSIADKVYMEPLTLEYVAKIIRHERPDALLASIGGQTALNLAVQLDGKGILRECGVKLLGTNIKSIRKAEDREMFRDLCRQLGEPVLPSDIASSPQQALEIASDIGYPVILRPAFTLGGTGGGFAYSEEELEIMASKAIELSPVSQVLIEKSIKGFKEIEYEVMRDANDTAITVCNMENIDPVGIHTGDSIVVCPSQTLTNKEYHMLRNSALKIIRALEIEGGCNVQFALDPKSFDYYLIEVNPRVSRSSALASKASGYPIARVSAKISTGMTLDEIQLANTPACFEPALDYVVTKMPRFPFDKFSDAQRELSTQMKATGEVMAVGRTLEESLLKAVRSLETGHFHLFDSSFSRKSSEYLLDFSESSQADRLYAIAELTRRRVSSELIHEKTGIDLFYINAVRNITDTEKVIENSPVSREILIQAKKTGFSDRMIAKLWNRTEKEIYSLRKKMSICPSYKMIDTCASEFESYVPYFYSSYERENESRVSSARKILVIGSGPIRIGQGIEFDYSSVHAVKTISDLGFESVIINNNPETVSTDYTCSDKLYFEPLTLEDVMNVIDLEKPDGVIVTLGGQTAINLAEGLAEHGIKIIGTGFEAIEKAENRDCFEMLLSELGIKRPEGKAVNSISDGLDAAEKIGYPVLVRPSFVLGGRAMEVVSKRNALEKYLSNAFSVHTGQPVLIDRYIRGKEVEVDAVCDGSSVFIPGIMELVERTGIHSGDSISVYPPYSLADSIKEKVIDYTVQLGLGIGIVGLFNIQFIVDSDSEVYIIEVNPRSSRTVPFLSKATGYSLSDIATKAMLGISLKEQGIEEIYAPEKKRFYAKAPVFSFSKLSGMDSYLSPEMKSTGEAIGYDDKFHRALFKAMIASGIKMQNYGTIIVTLADEDKQEALPLVRRFYEMGFNIEATIGTSVFLCENSIRNRLLRKISEGSTEILDEISRGYVSYVICTRALLSGNHYGDGARIRKATARNNITMLSSLDTVKILLDVLEEVTIGISRIDE